MFSESGRDLSVPTVAALRLLPHFSRHCSLHPPTSARCCPTESATRFWCRARKRPDKRCACLTTFCKRLGRGFLKRIMLPVPPADGRYLICRPRRRKSKQQRCTLKASRLRSWVAL